MKYTLHERIRRRLEDAAITQLRFSREGAAALSEITTAILRALRAGRRIWLFGNGGSAADAQHIAAELEGRFCRNRRALPAMALTTNSSTLTAVANDLGYEATFARQVEAHVRRGDVVIAISTSGNSPNVLAGARAARKRGAVVVGFTGRTGGKLKGLVDLCLHAPSDDTARIQECHGAAGHVLCEFVEAGLDAH